MNTVMQKKFLVLCVRRIEVENMTCPKCKGQMIIWEKDRFGHSKATSCPLCNKSGQSVAKKLAEMKKK